jgi:hypothetical protein
MRSERMPFGITDNPRRLHRRYRELTGNPVPKDQLRIETRRSGGDRTGALMYIVVQEELKQQTIR